MMAILGAHVQCADDFEIIEEAEEEDVDDGNSYGSTQEA